LTNKQNSLAKSYSKANDFRKTLFAYFVIVVFVEKES
jgi:hypothetical protein